MSLTNWGSVCVIKTKCDGLRETPAFCVATRIVSALLKEYAVARSIFLGVQLKAYLAGGCKYVITHISISINLGVYFLGGTNY